VDTVDAFRYTATAADSSGEILLYNAAPEAGQEQDESPGISEKNLQKLQGRAPLQPAARHLFDS